MGWFESTPDDPGGWIPGLPDPGDVYDWANTPGGALDTLAGAYDATTEETNTLAAMSAVTTIAVLGLGAWLLVSIAPEIVKGIGVAR